MSLDPQIEAVLVERSREGGPPLEEQTPDEARRNMLRLAAALVRPDCVARIEDFTIPGPAGPVPVRLYVPRVEGTLPAMVYFHGGGWVVGSLETHDALCRLLADAGRCAVVSVDYRLAPEHPFPAAPEDAYAAARWVADDGATRGIDGRRVAVGGDSAGGNLAAVVSLMARDRGGPSLSFQLLVYPVADCDFDTASYLDNAEGFLLTREGMKWFWNHYLEREDDAFHPYVSPARASDLGGLPPAHVITAEYDPLRDEGESYAKLLEEAGVPVTLKRYDGMVHGFLRMTDSVQRAHEALVEIGGLLGKYLSA